MNASYLLQTSLVNRHIRRFTGSDSNTTDSGPYWNWQTHTGIGTTGKGTIPCLYKAVVSSEEAGNDGIN